MSLLDNLHPPGLLKSLQNWTEKDLSGKEIVKLNAQILSEAKKYPHLDVSGIVVNHDKKTDINFFYRERKPISLIDRIDNLIDSMKKELRPKR